ncbi:MAG: BREX-1 system phosphatase PglZ type A, partial [Chloroflexi bacterium]|nr:BREX-1 system phosphatase PglZ type A [Chloroflexota bacterium]
MWNLVQDHIEFFKDERCRIALKTRLVKDDGHNAIRIKMLAVCVNADIENRIESILEVLLADLAESQREKFGLIQVCNLDAFLWEKLATHFGYKSQSPSIRDFAITLFKSCYAQALDEESVLTQDALVFLKRWRDSIHYRESFENLSEEFAGILGVEQDLQNRDVLPLIDVDFFRLIDQRILSGLAQQIHERTLSAGDYANIIWRRRTTHWYKEFSDMYEALYYGSQFIHELGNADLHMDTLADGVRKYQNTWYKLDQHYRKFIMHVRAVQQKDLLVKLIELVENLYSNNYLLQVSDNWQKQVDSAPLWDAAPIPRQSEFFSRYISEYLANKNKVAVIISDALRYEIGQELAEIIEKEEGYSVEIDSMLSELPSYTQLGMAALLPNSELKILPDGNVLVDGKPSAGLENRSKILSNTVDKGSIALRSEELLSMNRDKYREVTKGAQVVYVYHDQIDHVGDDRTSEGQVFDVVEKASSEILTLMKKLYDSYFSNILITADHGF